jgi:hypothetical protein
MIAIPEIVDCKNFELRPCPYHVALSGIGKEKVTVGVGNRACPGRRNTFDSLRIYLLARGYFPSLDDTRCMQAIQVLTHNDRRA